VSAIFLSKAGILGASLHFVIPAVSLGARPVQKAANTIAKAAKETAKRAESSAGRKTVGKKMAARVAKKKKARGR
jgi:hypothetical protein